MTAPRFAPLSINALYPTIERGLTADILAARALGGHLYPICTSHIVAGGGRVTDVLEVPADTVSSQLEHVFATAQPAGVKIGIAGSAPALEGAIDLIGMHLRGPIVLDMTLSGPSGEDLADGRVRDALVTRFPLVDVVSLRRVDAEIVVGMQIESLDDMQVAVQRLQRLGARAVLLRAGKLDGSDGPMATDLVYDGDDFALFEAPWIQADVPVHGASSAFHLALLKAIGEDAPLLEAVQSAKAFVTESLRRRDPTIQPGGLAYFNPSGVPSR